MTQIGHFWLPVGPTPQFERSETVTSNRLFVIDPADTQALTGGKAAATQEQTGAQTELLDFVDALAEEFGLPPTARDTLYSDDPLQVRATLTHLGTRIGESINAISPTGENYDAIKARFVADLTYLKAHYGFSDVIKALRELTDSVDADVLKQEQQSNAALRKRCVELEKHTAVVEAQLQSRLGGTLCAPVTWQHTAALLVDDMSGDDL